MNKKYLSVPIILSVAALALSACGPSGESEPNPASSAFVSPSESGSPSETAASSQTAETTPEATDESTPEAAPVELVAGYTAQDHFNAGGGCFSDYFPLGEPSAEALSGIQAQCATADPAGIPDEGDLEVDAYADDGQPAAFTEYDDAGNPVGAGVAGPPPEDLPNTHTCEEVFADDPAQCDESVTPEGADLPEGVDSIDGYPAEPQEESQWIKDQREWAEQNGY